MMVKESVEFHSARVKKEMFHRNAPYVLGQIMKGMIDNGGN